MSCSLGEGEGVGAMLDGGCCRAASGMFRVFECSDFERLATIGKSKRLISKHSVSGPSESLELLQGSTSDAQQKEIDSSGSGPELSHFISEGGNRVLLRVAITLCYINVKSKSLVNE